MKKRIAFISEHASPLALIGGVDSGGQNIYVAKLAVNLARQGFLIDVYTRNDHPALQEVQLVLQRLYPRNSCCPTWMNLPQECSAL